MTNEDGVWRTIRGHRVFIRNKQGNQKEQIEQQEPTKEYKSEFLLEAEVNDFDDAQAYLTSDDMSQYLPDELKDVVKSVEWTLDDESSGHVSVKTTRDLNENELTSLRDWIDGQNSDGLGEGFEQQKFAETYYNPYTGDGPYTYNEAESEITDMFDNMDAREYSDYIDETTLEDAIETYMADGGYDINDEEARETARQEILDSPEDYLDWETIDNAKNEAVEGNDEYNIDSWYNMASMRRSRDDFEITDLKPSTNDGNYNIRFNDEKERHEMTFKSNAYDDTDYAWARTDDYDTDGDWTIENPITKNQEIVQGQEATRKRLDEINKEIQSGKQTMNNEGITKFDVDRKEFNDDEYNLYKQAKENPDSINSMTEWSTDWEALDKKYRDRYEQEIYDKHLEDEFTWRYGNVSEKEKEEAYNRAHYLDNKADKEIERMGSNPNTYSSDAKEDIKNNLKGIDNTKNQLSNLGYNAIGGEEITFKDKATGETKTVKAIGFGVNGEIYYADNPDDFVVQDIDIDDVIPKGPIFNKDDEVNWNGETKGKIVDTPTKDRVTVEWEDGEKNTYSRNHPSLSKTEKTKSTNLNISQMYIKNNEGKVEKLDMSKVERIEDAGNRYEIKTKDGEMSVSKDKVVSINGKDNDLKTKDYLSQEEWEARRRAKAELDRDAEYAKKQYEENGDKKLYDQRIETINKAKEDLKGSKEHITTNETRNVSNIDDIKTEVDKYIDDYLSDEYAKTGNYKDSDVYGVVLYDGLQSRYYGKELKDFIERHKNDIEEVKLGIQSLPEFPKKTITYKDKNEDWIKKAYKDYKRKHPKTELTFNDFKNH